MPEKLILNGELLNSNRPIIGPDSRALRFGDGLFDALKVASGSILLADLHFERLLSGIRQLGFTMPVWLSKAWLHEQVLRLCKANGHPHARVRTTIFRGDGGLFDPANNNPEILIQSWALDEADFSWNENGLDIGIYTQARKSNDAFSMIKTNNFLPYIMAAAYAKEQRWNEAVILNPHNNIADATISNIFIAKDDIISTPALSDGCIAGVMRQWLLSQEPGIKETSLTANDLLDADEIFLTNSVRGLRWVKSLQSSRYSSKLGAGIFSRHIKNLVEG